MLLLILPGFILRKINFINSDAAKACSLIVLYCAQPCMLIDAYMREYDAGLFSDMLKVGLLSLIMYMCFILIASFMFKKAPPSRRPILQYMMIFSNCGYMGFPVLRQISRSFFADSSIHALRFLSLLLRLLSFDFSLCILLAQAGQYFDIPELGTYSTPHTVQFLGFNAVHRFVGVICNSPTKPMNL